jgi:hypothetical protein
MFKHLQSYTITSNRESGKGRYDILIRTPRIQGKAIIIELKATKSLKKLEDVCDQALSQIAEKNYTAELQEEGYKDILKYGIAFCKKDCLVKLG